MENNNTNITFDELNPKSDLDNNIAFSQTISKKELVQLNNLNNTTEKNTTFSEQIIDGIPLETNIEQFSYDYSKPHREILMVKQI